MPVIQEFKKKEKDEIQDIWGLLVQLEGCIAFPLFVPLERYFRFIIIENEK